MNLLERSTGSELSLLKDPFNSTCIHSVTLRWVRLMSHTNPWIYATVVFVNGSTKGEQTIEADSMDELIQKTKAFLETLPRK